MNGKMVSKLSLFGEVDVAEVPDDPFHVDDGTYLTALTEVKAIQTNSDGQDKLVLKFSILDEGEFYGNSVQDYKNFYPEATQEEIEANTDMKKDLARLKQRLLSIGVPVEDMGSFMENHEEYLQNEYYVTVRNTPDKADPDKTYRNVTFVRPAE